MSHSSSATGPAPRRRRHRSLARKLAESLALYVGVPLLLLAVLALSVDVIEYRPWRGKVRVEPAVVPPPVRAARPEVQPALAPDLPALDPQPLDLESLPPLVPRP